MRTTRLIIPVALVGLALAGCSTTANTTKASSADGAAASMTNSHKQPAPTTDAAAASSSDNLTAHYGDSRDYHDGISVTVAAPQPFTPSDSAAGGQPGDTYLQWAVTITNNSQSPWDPSTVTVSATAGGSEGGEVYDSAKGIGGGPSSMVLPGRSVTWKEVFALPGATDPILQVTPGFQYEPSLFTQ